MATYKAPLRDMRFVLNELVGLDNVQSLPGCEEISPDLVDSILEEAAKVCEHVLFPLNRSGDEEGCHFDGGEVRTPKGFKEAYTAFADGGWTAVACDTAYGGQDLPRVINSVIEEMICSSNFSFGMYPGLTHGAYSALHTHGSEELKQTWLPDMVSGKWSGTMCLTEPHCGTDLGLVRTRAVPQPDGSFKVTGTKIFISAGEHDLTENIVHLVLARTPDAPKGIKGISLFLVPKFRITPEGAIGPRNGVACGSIEHKMGIKASSTCVMNFDDATGWLVGEPNKGMRAMFTMMNEARLSVGVQGLGIGEASYQGAVAYARERRQGRALTGARHPDQPADPLIVHPDIRRMLLTQRAWTEGARALAAWISLAVDRSHRHPDPETRREAEDLVAIMTPVIKAFFTDIGFETANLGVQVFGGHGYIREHGMEQYVRDARIAQIYEGTNGVQALDLVGRKLPVGAGRTLRRFFHPVFAFLEQHQDNPDMAEFIGPLAKGFGRLQQATAFVARQGMRNPNEAGAAATDYLRLFGLVALAFMWARMAEIALPKVGGDESAFYKAKLDTARFYMQRLLPQSGACFSALIAGSGSIMGFDEEAF